MLQFIVWIIYQVNLLLEGCKEKQMVLPSLHSHEPFTDCSSQLTLFCVSTQHCSHPVLQ